MVADFISNPCTFYFATLNSAGFPIPSTQRSKHTNDYDKHNNICTETRLPPTQMVAPVGKKQCFSKDGFRYFYQVNIRNNRVIPNSLMQIKGKPSQMCIGVHQWLEWKKFF